MALASPAAPARPDPRPPDITRALDTRNGPAAVRIECVDDFWGFTALGPQWNALLRESAADGPFLTWEWLNAWWTHLHSGSRLRLVTARDGQDLIAIAPMRRVRDGVGFQTFEFLGTGYAGSDYLDLIVRRGREADAIRALSGYFRSRRIAMRLDHLPETSIAAQLAARLTSARWVASTAAGGVCPIIRLAGHSWESYLATLGSAHRANVRRRLRSLEQRFQVRFERVTTDRQRQDALASLVAFHRRRWQHEGGSTAFITPAVCAFQDEATARALERESLRMYVLRLDAEVAAVMYGFYHNRQFYFYQHGFDDRLRQHSVGLALMALTIQAAIDEGAQTFDMLWGVEPYKWLWTRDTRLLQRIELFPPGLRGGIHRRALTARRAAGALRRRLRTGEAHE